MPPADKRLLSLVLCLSAMAGYADALGFISMGGFFVSFMSGNSTRLGVALLSGGLAAVPLLIIFLFVGGVICGSLIGHAARDFRLSAIVSFVTLTLAVAGGLHERAGSLPAAAAMAMAMGAVNTLFEKDGEVSLAVTYMTGTLVRMGQRIAGAFTGGPRDAWTRYLALWLSFTAGACAGTAAYAWIGLDGIWLSVAASSVLALTAYLMERTRRIKKPDPPRS